MTTIAAYGACRSVHSGTSLEMKENFFGFNATLVRTMSSAHSAVL
jgi:hypothetical protein